jgi:hypothetical protein
MIGEAIVPEFASTAGIGRNVTEALRATASDAGFGGLISQIGRMFRVASPAQ